MVACWTMLGLGFSKTIKAPFMYGGVRCCHIALDDMGTNATAHYAIEIDKYSALAMQYNYFERENVERKSGNGRCKVFRSKKGNVRFV